MSARTIDDIGPSIQSVLRYVIVIDAVVLFAVFAAMTTLLLWLQPANMDSELLRITVFGNTFGIVVLAFLFIAKNYIAKP